MLLQNWINYKKSLKKTKFYQATKLKDFLENSNFFE